MEITELFPTHIFKHKNEILAESLLPLCNKYTAESNTNCLHIENFPSTLYSKEQEKQVMEEPLVQEALEYIKGACLRPFLEYRNIGLPGPLRPYGFFSSMEKHAYLRKHAHLDCFISGIIYLEVGEDVPPIVFYDSRPYSKYINYNGRPYTQKNEILHVVKPEPGMILMWDAWLEHEVYQKTNDNPRKSFVFNL
jgi:Putative 2OG-Fe(II) oxygenase